jgi:cyclic pyranopterin phosphate synthase
MNAPLSDSHGRRIEYVRLSVTDRCSLRCFYCLPKGARAFAEPAHWLTFDEIGRVTATFAALGVRRIRLTGGEPLLRRDLPELARRIAALPGVEDVSLSTNAVLLADHARALRRAGVARVNVSLDTLRPDRFARITGSDRLDAVIAGLRAARAAGFRPIKINMVALKGINDDEFEDMVEFCLAQDFTLRLIETMPMGSAGHLASRHFLDLRAVRARLAGRYELIPSAVPGGGPARYVSVGGTRLHIGFITPISQHFCATCNRVRLAVDGTLYLCLGQEHRLELRPLLRRGIDDAGLRAALVEAIRRKPERHDFNENARQMNRLMSVTGG